MANRSAYMTQVLRLASARGASRNIIWTEYASSHLREKHPINPEADWALMSEALNAWLGILSLDEGSEIPRHVDRPVCGPRPFQDGRH